MQMCSAALYGYLMISNAVTKSMGFTFVECQWLFWIVLTC